MRAVIFGGTGFLGTSINKFLQNKGFECFISSYKKKSHFKSNLQSEKKIYNFLKKTKPEIIINCSGEANVDFCNKNFLKAHKSNTLSVRNIVSSVKKLKKTPYFIQISTDQIYNSKNTNVEKNINLSNYYSITKYLGEIEAQNLKNSLIIRTNFFGKSYANNRLSFSDYLIYNITKKSNVSVPSNIYFNPIHINHLLDIIFKLMNKKITGVFNIGSEDYISKFDFAKKIVLKKKLNAKYLKSFKSDYLIHQRPFSTIMSTKKIKSKIKIKLPSVQSGINLL